MINHLIYTKVLWWFYKVQLVCSLHIREMDSEVVRIVILPAYYLFLLGLWFSVKGSNRHAIEEELLLLPSVKLSLEGDRLTQICISDDIISTKIEVYFGNNCCWKFLHYGFIDDLYRFVAVASLDVDTALRDVINIKWTFVEVFNEGEDMWILSFELKLIHVKGLP